MISIDPKETPTQKLHGFMLASVAPRPICFASTVDKEGNINLSPFSFFNVFGSNPPTAIFSPARRVRDNTIKHTLENIYETMEVCINVVTYDMVQQVSLSSVEYPKGVNEFVKAGFTELKSDIIKAPRVKESPVQMECIVKQVIETGKEGGAGNLIIAEIVKMHINEDILGEDGTIDQRKIHLVARLGKDWYCKAFGEALFEVEKPGTKTSIGYDQLPEEIKFSQVLNGNQLGQLANCNLFPTAEEIEAFSKENPQYTHLKENERQEAAAHLLNIGKSMDAWKILLQKN